MIAVAQAQWPFIYLEDVTMQDQEDTSKGGTQPWGGQVEEENDDDDGMPRTGTSHRGYSDSVLSCRLPVDKMHRPSFSGCSATVSASPPFPDDNDDEVAVRRSIHDPDLPRRVKTRHVLRLPPFQSLGLCGPLPGSLPTPPDEITQSDFPIPAVLPQETGERMSFPEDTSLPTPDPVDVLPPSVSSISEPQSSATMMAEAPSVVAQDASGPLSSSANTAEAADLDTEISSFLMTPINIATSNLPAESLPSHHTINIMSHSQPCPLSQDEGAQTTAYEPLIDRLRSTCGPGTFFDVTIAVPFNFEPSRVLASPMGTPVAGASTGDAEDYFTHNNNIFARVALAPDHYHAMTIAGPPSPRTAVPPSSIQISILERYIPPPSMPEYADLFGLEGPSVLVDRLFELSPRNGTLIFVYPTARGAAQFCDRCLHPVIDPMLRTLVSVHGLSNDFGFAITHMPTATPGHGSSRRALLDFDRLQAKLTALLARLSRPSPSTSSRDNSNRNPARPTPTFTLAHSTAHTVALDPATWIPWWLHQEKDRVRTVVDRYYQRGHRVPDERILSAGSLAHLILGGLRDRIPSGESLGESPGTTIEQQGVEVGVFVVVRSS